MMIIMIISKPKASMIISHCMRFHWQCRAGGTLALATTRESHARFSLLSGRKMSRESSASNATWATILHSLACSRASADASSSSANATILSLACVRVTLIISGDFQTHTHTHTKYPKRSNCEEDLV